MDTITKSDFGKNVPFMLNIPKVICLADRTKISLSTIFKFKPQKSTVTVLLKVILEDRFGKKYVNTDTLFCVNSGVHHANLVCDFCIDGSFRLTGSTVKYVFGTAEGKKYIFSYYGKNSHELQPISSLNYDMDSAEQNRAQLIVKRTMQKPTNASGIHNQSQSSNSKHNKYDEDTSDDPYQDTPEYSISALAEFRNAVKGEMLYLKNNGGRKYKISKGERIVQKNDIYVYSFELEAELYISDDAPVTVSLADTKPISGTVLFCEEFQIVLVLSADIGEKVSSAIMNVEPWKLLDCLYRKLFYLNRSNRLAVKLLEEGPLLSTNDPAEKIPKGQEKATERAEKSDITIIWGPPGTGKTYTMAEIAIDFLKKGQSVLIVSHSNISVDGAIKQIAKQAEYHPDILRMADNGEILRYGYVRDDVLSKNQDYVSFNYAIRKSAPELKGQLELLEKRREVLSRQSSKWTPERVKIEKKIKNIHASIRDEEIYYVSKAKLVATTISKVNMDHVFKQKTYDAVMFDEVSMAYVPQILSAAMLAKKHLICVGDFRQLPPIAQSSSKGVLQKDIFSFLHISGPAGIIHFHPWLVMLDEQRRMHPDISAFPNRYVYNKLLHDYRDVEANRRDIVMRIPFNGHAMNLIDLRGTYCAAGKNNDNSRYNIVSAVVSFLTALTAEAHGEKNIGIITPYAAQTRLIRAMIQDHYAKKDSTNISCATVHQFQGSERDVIIFDAVESYPASHAGWLMSKNENGSVTRLINVAITRARGKFIAVADSRFWLNKFAGTTHLFYRLVRYLIDKGNVLSCSNKALSEYLQHIESDRDLKKYGNKDIAYSSLKSDLENAHNRIIFSIPDGKMDDELQDGLRKLLIKKIADGIPVMGKTTDFDSLPEKWKELTWSADNATIPLIVIDDEIIWYGMLASSNQFTDKNISFSTICPLYFRFTGKHAVEMISSLTDLEYRIVDGNRTLLKPKYKAGGSSDEGGSLAEYIKKTLKCPKCGASLRLKKNRKGTCYLGCSSCDHVEYLTKECVNKYIYVKHIKCPKDGGDLQAGLGSHGVYIRCSHDHFLGPDKI